MRHIIRLLAFMFAVTLVCAAQQATPPGLAAALERWKTGFTAGDDAAVQSLYSSTPLPGFAALLSMLMSS